MGYTYYINVNNIDYKEGILLIGMPPEVVLRQHLHVGWAVHTCGAMG